MAQDSAVTFHDFKRFDSNDRFSSVTSGAIRPLCSQGVNNQKRQSVIVLGLTS